MSIVTLLTDFGYRDWYVGSMKGVILGLAPHCTIVDITHEIPPGDVLRGALVLREACRFFPPLSVHVAIVDPGVGTSRKAIVARGGNMFFVGPDNGILSMAVELFEDKEVRAIEREELFLERVSDTFHGRDVFAPVAAFLAKGGEMMSLGRKLSEWVRIPFPEVTHTEAGLEGQVLHVDRFGNGVTNIPEKELRKIGEISSLRVSVEGLPHDLRIRRTYAEVPLGSALALVGSSGFLEIAVNGGDASKLLHLEPGKTRIRVLLE